jgi:anti-anti-sigma factor
MIGSEPILGSFAIRGEHLDGVVRIVLAGEIDIATVAQLEEGIAAAEPRATRSLIVDVGSLGFMGSVGLQSLIRAHKRATSGGRNLIVVNADENIRKLFVLTGTAFLLQDPGGDGETTDTGAWTTFTIADDDG